MPFFTCIVLSHDKAAYVGEALASLVAQTFPDWEAVVFDSGLLYDRGFFDRLPAARDPRVRLVRSWETDELRRTKTIASWCFNECFRKGLVRGKYVTYLCDDDLLYPNAFQAFHAYAAAHPDVQAMFGSIDLTGLTARGEKCRFREILAEEVKGSCCGGGPLDTHVDYLQLCHAADLLALFPDDEYWPEDRAVIRHADGIFLEKIGRRAPVYPVNVKIGENRKVPLSLNDGGDRLEYQVRLCLLERSLADLRAEHGRVVRERARLEEEKYSLVQTVSALETRWREGLTNKPLRYRVVDKVHQVLTRLPWLHGLGTKLLRSGWRSWRRGTRQAG